MMVRLHSTTTPTVGETSKIKKLALDSRSMLCMKDTMNATLMNKSRTQWDQTTTQVKRLDFSSLTYAKSSLMKTSTVEPEILQAAP